MGFQLAYQFFNRPWKFDITRMLAKLSLLANGLIQRPRSHHSNRGRNNAKADG
jgi:hypothetical protein